MAMPPATRSEACQGERRQLTILVADLHGLLDWARRHGIRLLLLESFVERGRFRGSCYQAANWLHAGVTRGRGRNDRAGRAGLPLKDIWLQPLEKDALHLLRAAL